MKIVRKKIKRFKKKLLGAIRRSGSDVTFLQSDDNSQYLELVVQKEPNNDWAASKRGKSITFLKEPLLSKKDRILTMGSCFAVEIRKSLNSRGFDTFPKYASIEFDPQTQLLAKLPKRDNINHYNTFVIRQEFELALEGDQYKIDDLVDLRHSQSEALSVSSMRFQDPYRKMLFARTESAIVDLSQKVTNCVRSAIGSADVYIITLGLTEVWKNNANGLYINQAPKNPTSQFSFVESDYRQNYENLAKVCSLIEKHFPSKKIILTVSPVPLSRTFTNRDVVVANAESKCTLRAVAAQISKEFNNVKYWPSYEIALARDLYLEDGRHIRSDAIELIVNQFQRVHVEGD
jgi:hypothetical protein